MHQNFINYEIIVPTSSLYYGNIISSFYIYKNDRKALSFYTPAISQLGAHLVTVLPAVLVPACAVLIVGAVTAVACVVRRRQSVAIKSRDGVDMISANREETEAGLVDTYIAKLRGYAKCHHPVAIVFINM